MRSFCTHLIALYYKPCSQIDQSREIECALNLNKCLAACETCDKFSARAFWQSQPKMLTGYEDDTINTEPPKKATTVITNSKNSWTPPDMIRESPTKHHVSRQQNIKTVGGCGGCGGTKNYTGVPPKSYTTGTGTSESK